jgi:hypothetical protein
MNNDRLRLIEIQDITRLNNPANYKRVENGDKPNRTAFYAVIGLLLCLLVAVVV